MTQNIFIIFIISLFSMNCFCVLSDGEYRINCGDKLREITTTELCNGVADCDDGSDELNLEICEVLSKNKCDYDKRNFMIKCSSHNLFGDYDEYWSNRCLDIKMACIVRTKCFSFHVEEICETVGHRLRPTSQEMNNGNSTFMKCKEEKNEFHEMAKFIGEAMNQTMERNLNECPPFFIPFGGTDKCVSLFTPVQVSWFEAEMFCESMTGSLAILDDVHSYFQLLKYIQGKEIKSRFWIGAKYSISGNGNSTESNRTWTWLNGKPVTMGAPFWSLYTVGIPEENKQCQDSERRLMPKFPGRLETCLSISEENFYYFSDEFCSTKLSPLCMTNKVSASSNKFQQVPAVVPA